MAKKQDDKRTRVQIPLTKTLQDLLEVTAGRWDRSQSWVLAWTLSQAFRFPSDFTDALLKRYNQADKEGLTDDGEIVSRLQVRLLTSTQERLNKVAPVFGCSPNRLAAVMAETVLLSNKRMSSFYASKLGKAWVHLWAGSEDPTIAAEDEVDDVDHGPV